MKVVATHFVMVISKPFGQDFREIKKVYELEHTVSPVQYVIEHQGRQTSYEKINQEQFNKLKSNGLEVDPEAPLV